MMSVCSECLNYKEIVCEYVFLHVPLISSKYIMCMDCVLRDFKKISYRSYSNYRIYPKYIEEIRLKVLLM